LTVIKKLLAIAVSGITYLRGLFPKKAYGTKHVEGLTILFYAHVIKQTREGGVFYLIDVSHTVSMFQKVTEFYQFRIQYTTNGAQMEFESNNNMVSTMSYGDTKRASVLLVRKLYTLMQNLGPLPDNVCLNMKLAYYNDVTPQDYQPPGFKNADGDTIEFGREPVKLAVGEVVAPFHALNSTVVVNHLIMSVSLHLASAQAMPIVQFGDVWHLKVNMVRDKTENFMHETHYSGSIHGLWVSSYENNNMII
uniref:HORMA domain containing 1 n=1 Tax=Sphaeramia orbicularis TaxID=375764 RepID=A0A673A7W1_9TELE